MKFKNISRVRILLISGVLICGLIGLIAYFLSNGNDGTEEEIQKNFLSYETIAETAAENLLNDKSTIKDEKKQVFLHLYKNDSLKYWNTNKMPVSRLSSLKFPASGLVHLKNGWYYSVQRKKGNTVAVASFLIKRNFQYENEYLRNEANPKITTKNFKLSLDEQEGSRIRNKEGNYCFSYVLNKEVNN